MAELYLKDEPDALRTCPSAVRPDEPSFIIVAGYAAGWLYEIAGLCFWAALILLLVLEGAALP